MTVAADPTIQGQRRLRTENRARIAWLMLRGVFGWRFVAAAGLLAIGLAGAMLLVFTRRPDLEPSDLHVLLGRVFAAFALILAAPLLPDERSRGTLEILWLACGSFRRLLRWKLFLLTTAITLCIVPAVAAADWFLGGRLAAGHEVIFLVTQSLLVAAWTFYVGSYLPQPWAGGLVAAAVFLTIDWLLSPLGNPFNPFAQLYSEGMRMMGPPAFIWNRILVLLLAWFFHDQASRRIRRWLV